MLEFQESDSLGTTVSLELDLTDSVYCTSQLTILAINALKTISEGLFFPLNICIVVDCFDVELGYKFKTSESPDKLLTNMFYLQEKNKEFYSLETSKDCNIIKVEMIDWVFVQDWIFNLVEQKSMENKFDKEVITFGWREISVKAMQVVLPQDSTDLSKGQITMIKDCKVIDYPCEKRNDEVYINAPLKDKSFLSPFEIYLDSEGRVITMNIYLYWSLWTIPQSPGWEKICDSINRLRQQSDWRCTFSSLDGLKPDSPLEY